MREEAFRVFGFIVFGLVIAIGILAAVQMLSVSALWSEGGAAWVQAVGSIAAIVGAYIFGERQAKVSLNVAAQAREMGDRRKRGCALAVCTAAHKRVNEIEDIFIVDFLNDLRRMGEYG